MIRIATYAAAAFIASATTADTLRCERILPDSDTQIVRMFERDGDFSIVAASVLRNSTAMTACRDPQSVRCEIERDDTERRHELRIFLAPVGVVNKRPDIFETKRFELRALREAGYEPTHYMSRHTAVFNADGSLHTVYGGGGFYTCQTGSLEWKPGDN